MSMKNPVHPGRIVKGCLDDLGLNITSAAKVLGVTRQTVSRVVNCKTAISDEMAIRLAKAFGSTPEHWLRMQHAYNLAQIKSKSDTINVQPYQHSSFA
ncbi:MAG: HigA family addiction module antidote protein [Candidatus Brocadiaceae bacterium]|nr:HigA family addiction module antidote protein [Candidatus Brocadiaceae bacterium]